MTTLAVPTLEPDSFDFMSLVVFRRRWGLRGGSFTRAFQQHPPVFRNPALSHYGASLSAFAVLLDAYRTQIDRWWDAHPDDGVTLYDAHAKAEVEEILRPSTSSGSPS
ncbi:hypothetical protein [Microbispora sp. ATCC PTA-5024]|uniref:hypothetical protein n=1 Tax=Microbispora sp. ATCC PTA-5024 TaxID=316330 RepID=UPI0003DD5E1F|nr:hypothetical protein [Microbispora sp. ATCC PTA-5024]ETK36169.1 hypothetical protein MPTA5024_11120 [Microbispora sp. ATCC PTA-5024]